MAKNQWGPSLLRGVNASQVKFSVELDWFKKTNMIPGGAVSGSLFPDSPETHKPNRCYMIQPKNRKHVKTM